MQEKNFFNSLKEEFNIELNEQQQQAVTKINGPSLVLAVPGSGKTTTLLSRTAYMISKGINPKNILSITFSKKSAEDMKERFDSTFRKVIGQDIQFLTIHSFTNGVVYEYYKLKGIPFLVIEGKSYFKKKKLLSDIYIKHTNNNYISDEKLEKLFNDISYAKNCIMTDVEIKTHTWSIKNFKDIFDEYDRIKRANGYIDYDDMMSECLKIFQNNPAILKKYRIKYKYIQVDEAQDTSKVQHEIIEILGAPNNNIFYVADDDQSIYGFRAACPEFLLNIEDTFPNIKKLHMEENYRSTGNIVSVCNEFIKENKVRCNKSMYTNKSEGNPVKIVDLKGSEQQYEDIISNIKDEDNMNNTAILFRNNISSILLADMLYNSGIKFKIKEINKINSCFFNHWIVVDMINYIKFAENTRDIGLFEKIYRRLQGYYISNNMFENIKRDYSDRTVFDKLIDLTHLESYQIEKILDLKKHFNIISKLEPRNAIDYIETNLKYASDNSDNSQNQNSIIINLKKLSTEMKTVSELTDKLNNLKHYIKESVDNNENNAVTLSSVHSSKGLEWDNVFMIDLTEGIFPGYNSDLEEERRLFYVGMTRAKKKLTLYRYNIHNNEDVNCSQFLEELSNILKSNTIEINNKIKKNNYHFKNKEYNIIELKNQAEAANQGPDIKELEELLNIDAGTVVEHKKYGQGVVISCDKIEAIVYFKGYDKKSQLSLKFCFENDILKIAS